MNETIIAEMTKIIERNATDADAFYNRALAHRQAGNLSQALVDISSSISLDREDMVSTYIGYAETNYNAGNFYKAINEYDMAISLKSCLTSAYVGRAMVYLKMRDYIPALLDFGMAIKLDPGNAVAYYNRAVTFDDMSVKYHEIQNKRAIASDKKHYLFKAIIDYSKAIELDTGYAEAYYKRGIDYYETGNAFAAIDDFLKVIELDSKHIEVKENIQKCFCKKIKINKYTNH